MSPINIQLLSPVVLPCKVAEHAKCAKKEFPPHFHLCSTNPWLPLSLHTIPTRKATRIKHSPSTPSLLPARSQHCSSLLPTHHTAWLFLGFVFCNHYPIVAWEDEFLVCLGKNPNNIALNAPGCDFFLSFHLLGRFKCNFETCRAKFIRCHWYSKDNLLRSRHLSTLISWLSFSFRHLDPCTPYICFPTCWKHWVVVLCHENRVVHLYRERCMSPLQRSVSSQTQWSEASKEACNKYTFRALPYYWPFSFTSAACPLFVSQHTFLHQFSSLSASPSGALISPQNEYTQSQISQWLIPLCL